MGNHPYTMYARPKKFKSDSVVVITGASSGIGRELTFRYAERGCRLIVGARNLKELQRVSDECNNLYRYSKVVPVQCDVTKESDCKRLIDSAIENFGKIDVLILNAGISAHFLFEECKDLDVFKKLMDVNFFGYLYPTKHALPHLKASHGQIVVMSSYSGEVGLIYRTGYCSSKFAVTGFFEALRMETSGQLDITIICPPTVETNLRKNAIVMQHNQNDEAEAVVSATPDDVVSESGSNLIDGQPSSKRKVLTLEQAVEYIVMAIDTKMRKVIFPHKAWYSSYMRPIIPDYVDSRLMQIAKL